MSRSVGDVKRNREASGRGASRSVVLYVLCAISARLYSYIASGLFGRMRYLYDRLQHTFETSPLRSVLQSRKKRHDRPLFRLRMALSAMIEQSALCRTSARLRRMLLHCSLNTYGIFCFFFGCFALVTYLLSIYFGAPTSLSHLVTAICMIGLALPLFASDKPLSRALGRSLLFRCLLVDVCGIPAEKLDGIGRESEQEDGEEHYFGALLLAVALGVVCALLSLPPYLIPALALLLTAVQLVLIYPEIGLLAVAFLAPLLTLLEGVHPTAVLLCVVGVTMLSYGFKLIGGKRALHPELLDLAVLLLGGLYLLGGCITHGGSASLYGGLTLALLLCCYFLAVGLLRTPAWIRRVVGALCASCVLVALLGILQYVAVDLGNRYVDLALFSDLGGRVYSTMENPNMLAEYLILLLPLLLATLLRGGRPLRTFGMLVALAAVVGCLVLTWSRGAWLGCAICLLLFLLLLGPRALGGLLLAAVPLTAVLCYLPDVLVRRFLSIGSMTDSSIRYRIHLWEGVADMLGDHWIAGVGVGESAFREVYGRYALPGIGGAVHSHSLYLQLLCELGVVGLVVFAAIMLMFLCSVLSYVTGSGDRRGRRIVLGAGCGVLALLLMGLADHVFYNYRIFLLFWLVVGVAVAQIRIGRAEAAANEPDYLRGTTGTGLG